MVVAAFVLIFFCFDDRANAGDRVLLVRHSGGKAAEFVISHNVIFFRQGSIFRVKIDGFPVYFTGDISSYEIPAYWSMPQIRDKFRLHNALNLRRVYK
jgi:hypothetical protein